MEASSSVVIKVKYGDTLRRFSSRIVGDELELSFDGLRKKILSLFSFDPDTELMLTYIDEDDDVVTLADDDDLRDVVQQALTTLRITVKASAEKNGLYNRSSGSSTPLRSPRVQQPLQTSVPEILKTLPVPIYETLVKLSVDLASKASSSSDHVQQPLENLNNGVAQILKTVPEPLRETLGKLSAHLATKAYSAPAITELVDHCSKLGMSYLDQISQSQPGVNSANTAVAETRDSDTSAADVRSELLTRNNENLKKLKADATGVNNEVKSLTENVSVAHLGNDSLPNSGGVYTEPAATSYGYGKKETVKRITNKMNGKSHLTSRMAPVVENNVGNHSGSLNSSSDVPFVVNNFGTLKEASSPSEPKVQPKPANVGVSDPTKGDYDDNLYGKTAGSVWATGPGSSNYPALYSGYSSIYECPFTGLGMGNGPVASPVPAPEAGPCRRTSSQNECSGNIFHRGVRCDGCGVHPITGPRFKSKVKVDYDLCSICFKEMGNSSDYIRMDRPAVYRHHMSFKGLHDARTRDRNASLQQVHRSFKVKTVAAKLDSRFIQDVNIFDGTVMAPLTPFTKIWRMRNNGTVLWPQRTQLVWIGGDKLSNELAVEVQIPAAGLMIDEELEVAVDFISPELPGRYISYWRMALPSGQKFGQRVWVLIQVDASLKDEIPLENVRNLNLNFPPVSTSLTGPEIMSVYPEPMEEKSKKMEESVQQPNTEQEMKFPINDTLLVGNGASWSSRPSSSAPPVSNPFIDLSDVVPAVSSVRPDLFYLWQPQSLPMPNAPVASAQEPEVELPGKVEVEEKLLKELEEMGFKEVDLNKRMLRMNEYDLEQAVDDLCGVAEWDPILEELQEMGFHDMETNKMLLKKNNGSIKRVVMDLIAGEKIE